MIMGFPQLGLQSKIYVAFLGAVLIVAFGFLFVTVSSRLTRRESFIFEPNLGETVATLLLTCLIFFCFLDWTGPTITLRRFPSAAIVSSLHRTVAPLHRFEKPGSWSARRQSISRLRF